MNPELTLLLNVFVRLLCQTTFVDGWQLFELLGDILLITTMFFNFMKPSNCRKLLQLYGFSKISRARVGYSPYGESGVGNHGSTLGKQSIIYLDPVRDRTLELVKSIPFPDKTSTFNIGDYGTADGASSMSFIKDLIVTLREHHGPGVQFQVIYEDLEVNDFNSLFKRLMGVIPNSCSYLEELDKVYPLASGINFYKQCVPNASMHFIMSLAAVHWLSKSVRYKDSIWLYPKDYKEEKEAVEKQAQADWETFLLHRSKELKQGGVALISPSAQYIDDKDTVQFCVKTFIYLLTDVWQSFRDSGKITSEEFANTNLDLCFYDLKQLKTPFEDKNSKVYQSGLRLLSAEVVVNKCVFYSAWKEKKELTGEDDRQGFAKSYVTAHRNWGHLTFRSGLSETRTQEEKELIIDELYDTVQNLVAKRNPEDFKNDIILAYVTIQKE